MNAVLDGGLRDALKALKLTGMLATLDDRLAQARDARLGHVEVLQLLLEDELARRQTAALQRRLSRARFETAQATLEAFDFTANPKLPTAAVRDLAALRWLTNGESIILYGPVGVGKTHLAQALGHNVIRRGIDVRFTKTSRLLADLAGGHADRSWDKRLREYTRPGVLICDDFAMRAFTDTQADDLYELTSDTRRSRPTHDPDQQPQTDRLVPAVPQPRDRRVPPRPADQHQPRPARRRTQLPTPQTTPARRLDTSRPDPVEPTPQATPWVIT